MLIGVGLALFAAAAVAAQSESAALDTPSAVQTLVQNCDAHKFETVITFPTANGGTKRSKLKMCGTEGQTDADWLRTLKDAIDKTAANPEMPRAVKDQIISAVKLEITRLGGIIQSTSTNQTLLSISGPGTDLAKRAPAPAPKPTTPTSPISRDYAGLPPLATTPPAPPRLITPGGPPLARPKLSFQCFNSADIAEGPCAAFERDTVVTVNAEENLPAGTSLRFVRGDTRADVAVAGLARGRSLRFALPGEVCQGVGGGTLEVQVVRRAPGAVASEQVVGSEGPYNLRC